MKSTKRFVRSKRYLLMWAERMGLVWLPCGWQRNPKIVADVRGLGKPDAGLRFDRRHVPVERGRYYCTPAGIFYSCDGEQVKLSEEIHVGVDYGFEPSSTVRAIVRDGELVRVEVLNPGPGSPA